MRRLESHREKTIKKNIFFIVVVFVLLIYFIFAYGIKILLSTSVFISNMVNRNNKDNYSVSKEDFYGTIDIDSIPSATNSSSITLAGRISNYDLLQVYLNDEKVREEKSTDSFTVDIDNLKEGNNDIYIIAKSTKNKVSKKTTVYSVIYKKEKPKLEISSPKDGDKTSSDEIKIVGKTDKEVIIEINSMPVVVNTLGEFQSLVKLQPGENKIQITAQDVAGNTEIKELKIIFEKN